MKGLDLGIYIISTISGIFTVVSSLIIAYYQRKLQKEIHRREQASAILEEKVNVFDKRYNVFIDFMYLFRLAQLLEDSEGILDIKTFEKYLFSDKMYNFENKNSSNFYINYSILMQKLDSIVMGEFCYPKEISTVITQFRENYYGYIDNCFTKSMLYPYSKEKYADNLRKQVIDINKCNIIENMRELIRINE